MKFIVGDLYYTCDWRMDGNLKQQPFVASWIYRGVVRTGCSSTSCDVPGQFYQFAPGDHIQFAQDNSQSAPLNVPSLKQAERHYLTWPELVAAIARFDKKRNELSSSGAQIQDPTSMKARTLHELLRQRPFKPFGLVMSSGQTYEVGRPEMAFLTRSDLLVGINETDEGVPAEFKICSLLHITAIEPLGTASAH